MQQHVRPVRNSMFFRDFAFAARGLRKSPVFTAAAMLTIALGIGASTAIFSVANAVLLRPLPYKNPDRLVFAIGDLRKRNVQDFPLSNCDFLDLRNGTQAVFEETAAVSTFRATVPREDGTGEQIRGANVSTNFFRTLGARVAVGRDFVDSDGVPQPAPPPAGAGGAAAPATPPLPRMVVLSHEFWQRRFGGDPNIIGKGMPGRQPLTTQIVGVLAPGFELLFPASTNIERLPDMFVAARIPYDAENRNQVQHRAIARLHEGVSIRQAQAAADHVTEETRKNFIISGTAGYAIRLEPMHQHVVEEVRPAIISLMGAVIFLLLIACANVANLLLVRASLRERELAVRTALGGSWWRLVSQTLAEAFLLAFGGAVAGVALASFGIARLRDIAPTSLPRLDGVRIDPTVLAFTAIASLIAAALFGLIPALRAARPDIAIVLRGSSRNVGLSGGGWMRNAVVVLEVALCFVLLVGSGLMFRSFQELQRVDPGFDSRNMLTFGFLGGRRGQNPAERAAFVRSLKAKLSAIPGVQSVTGSFPFPLTGNFSPIRWGLEPALSDPSRFMAVDFQFVLPGYFDTVRTPILAGRAFTEADNTRDAATVVVDTMLAAKAFPGQSALGKRILIRARGPQPEWVQIIGIAAHQRVTSLADPGREQIYITDGYVDHGAIGRIALRTAGDPAALASSARAAVAQQDKSMVVIDMQTMDAVADHARAGTRFQLLLIGIFAVIAAILAGVGLYGVLSTMVRQRSAEIGVRVALGAAPGTIFSLIVGHGLRLSAVGVGVGLIAAYGLTNIMKSMLVGVKPTDPLTFIAMVLLFLSIAAVSSWLPARRAAGLDPTRALRDE
jgi:putative ABC transport system permease protein